MDPNFDRGLKIVSLFLQVISTAAAVLALCKSWGVKSPKQQKPAKHPKHSTRRR